MGNNDLKSGFMDWIESFVRYIRRGDGRVREENCERERDETHVQLELKKYNELTIRERSESDNVYDKGVGPYTTRV